MKLEDEVTSFELSKKLFQLGIQEKSLFVWQLGTDEKPTLNLCFAGEINSIDWPALTTGKLLQLLPYHLNTQEPEPFNSYRLYISGSVIVRNPELIACIRTTLVNYRCDTYRADDLTAMVSGKYITKNIWDENSANALAKMLIYLIENKLYEVVSEN